MLGSIVGDIVGSVHEFKHPPTKTKDFGSLFVPESHFTDDTVCTLAIAEWLMDRENSTPAEHLRELCNLYPKKGYGGLFSKWVQDPNMGAYNSWGNGAPMRVSYVGYAAKSLDEAYQLAEQASECTHNHPEAIRAAKFVAGFIFLARQGRSEIYQTLNSIAEPYNEITSTPLNTIRQTYKYDVSAKGTTPQAFRCVLEGKSFEDVIRNAISLGGDADTLACIAGALAEPVFEIPDSIISEALSRLDERLRDVILRFAKTYQVAI